MSGRSKLLLLPASVCRGQITELLKSHAYHPDESEGASARGKKYTGEICKTIEVELALMYDMLYTKAQVIHTWYGYCARAISLVSCFVALVVFTKSKRDGYSTPNIVITFALLGGACALEIASVFKAIGSTWTCSTLRNSRWFLLANTILFAHYYLVKDGRCSDSAGKFNLISFCVHSRKSGLKGSIARLIRLRGVWDKARCTKHPKLSPAVKKFVWGLLRGGKSDMVQIEDVAIQSGYWARRFSGFAQSEHLDWSMSCEFQKSVLIWHIATSTLLNHPDVKPELVDKVEAVNTLNTLSDYMMYLLVEHPNILPSKADARSLFHHTCKRLTEFMNHDPTVDEVYQTILGYKEERGLREQSFTYDSADAAGKAVLEKANTLAGLLLDLKLGALGVTYKMVIIGKVWTEMLCYAATNASEGFHARQLSNGGEFLTHILLLTQYAAAMHKLPKPVKVDDWTVEASAASDAKMDVENGWKDEITESC
ncbi:hypothetical protein CFC21_105688 [Triticum aestivum]|uniref:DUF4220 domain-containing protein n=2 Tax=Triticum aestivum TaxID=4565 RepID=A0A9R1N8Q0_WHEAT|nr:hypothetical protein CFC21_105688 [Triticum aestivum]